MCKVYANALFTDSDIVLSVISKSAMFLIIQKYKKIQCLEADIFLLHKTYQQALISVCIYKWANVQKCKNILIIVIAKEFICKGLLRAYWLYSLTAGGRNDTFPSHWNGSVCVCVGGGVLIIDD